jgi:hypothetical protein
VSRADVVMSRFVLGDLLDDAILGARPGDEAFPLRLVLGDLGGRLEEDDALVFAASLNLFFRAPMEDEDRAVIGIEASRAFYRFAKAAAIEVEARAQAAPLLAKLLGSQLARLRFEAVDHVPTYDSKLHEREVGANQASHKVIAPASFLCRVAATGAVRTKAGVFT